MHINEVHNSPTFGYNRALNKKLIKTLESQKEDKVCYQQMLKLLNLVNETEDKIREAEKNKQKNLMEHLSDAFLAVKSNLSAMIDSYFPELKYSERELKTYQNEIKRRKIKDPNHWLNDTVYEMSDFSAAEAENIEGEFLVSGPEALSQSAQEAKERTKEVKEMMQRLKYTPLGHELDGFKSLGGMEKIKKEFNDDIVSLIKDPEKAKRFKERYGIGIPKSILLYGPPGCGKTAIVERLSVETGLPLYKVDMGNAGNTYAHGASMNLSDVFEYAEKEATPEKPVIIMLDEADSILAARNEHTQDYKAEELNVLLTRMQDARKKNIIVISATNRLDKVDKAAKDRHEKIYFIGAPDKETRKAVISVVANRTPEGRGVLENKELVKNLVDLTDAHSNRTIEMAFNNGLRYAANDGERFVELKDFEKAIAEIAEKKINEREYMSNAQRPRAGFV